MSDFQWLDGGITAVPGILAAGITAGIKPSGKKDLALIYSSSPARAAAVFTTNQVKGAPVQVSRDHIKGGQAQAIATQRMASSSLAVALQERLVIGTQEQHFAMHAAAFQFVD